MPDTFVVTGQDATLTEGPKKILAGTGVFTLIGRVAVTYENPAGVGPGESGKYYVPFMRHRTR